MTDEQIGQSLADKQIEEMTREVRPILWTHYKTLMRAFANFFGRATEEEQNVFLKHQTEALAELNDFHSPTTSPQATSTD